MPVPPPKIDKLLIDNVFKSNPLFSYLRNAASLVMVDGLKYRVTFKKGKPRIHRMTHAGKYKHVWNEETREKVLAEYTLTNMASSRGRDIVENFRYGE